MSAPVVKSTKWRDPEGNVYGVEKSIRTSKCVVIRTNFGGNRKGCRRIPIAGAACAVQKLLDAVAVQEGWKEVAQ